MTIEQYLTQIRRRLARFGPLSRRPIAEIREHLTDSTQALKDEGSPPTEAEEEAVRRFGDPGHVAAQMAAVLNKESDPMERIVKILSITNMFTAVWGLAAVALLNPRPNLLVATVVVSVATVAAALAVVRTRVDPGTVVVSGAALSAVGGAGILWALISDRAEFSPQIGVALLMGLYLAQGVLAMLMGSRRAAALADEDLPSGEELPAT